jgi:cell division protein FtsW (lipid II flippase)
VLPHYRFIRLVAWPAMWVCLGLLVFLLIPQVPSWLVTPRNGARAWINLGPVDFQPAEVAKIAFIMVVANYLRYRKNHRTIVGLIPIGLIAFVPVTLIMLQPDLGMAILFVPTLFAMLVAAGAKLSHLSIVVVIAMCAAPAAYPLLKPHQKQRLLGLVHMMQESNVGADGINFQSLTARTLTGAGGVVGHPDAKARSLIKFNRLPERHNDMIYAVIVLRFGMVGGLAVLGLYLLWFAGALLTAAVCRDPFGRLVVVGCATIIAAQMFINVGMNIGIVPIIGLTLPFVSYGGSSMLTVWVMTGLVVNIAMRRPPRLARPSFEFDEDADEEWGR